MSQEFTVVRNRRSKKKGPLKKAKHSGSFAYTSHAAPKIKVEDFMDVFNTTKAQIEACSYYKNLCSTASKYLEKTEDIICYGIGSVHSNKQSLHQFALITLLRTDLKITGELCIFDPKLTEEDLQFARNMGCTIINTNEEGKRKVSNKTIFYMPHCTKPLYSNVLWANWSPENLPLIAILGNSFSHYNLRMIQKRNINVDYVERITECTTEVNLQQLGEAPLEHAFNDMNLHIFEVEKLRPELWEDTTEPPPFPADDPELIGASQQNVS